ncbi:MAG: AIR synthase-related protein [Chloroflexota bacterium]
MGDPFAEKLLIEASLELIDGGLVEGLQDLGAAGITCAVSETADRAGTGIAVTSMRSLREPGLEPFEVTISESQERMLAIVRPDRLDGVLAVCRRWDLPAAVMGRVIAEPTIRIVTGGITEDGRPAPGGRILAEVRPRRSPATPSSTIGWRGPDAGAPRRRPAMWRRRRRRGCPSVAWTRRWCPGAVGPSQPRLARLGLQPVRLHGRGLDRGGAQAPPSSGCRGPASGWPWRPTPTSASACSTRGRAPRSRSSNAPSTWR